MFLYKIVLDLTRTSVCVGQSLQNTTNLLSQYFGPLCYIVSNALFHLNLFFLQLHPASWFLCHDCIKFYFLAAGKAQKITMQIFLFEKNCVTGSAHVA